MQQFNKEELNMILKFGAEDLFKEGEAGVEAEQEKEVCSIIAIFAPMIYTAFDAFDAGKSITSLSGRGWTLEIETFLAL